MAGTDDLPSTLPARPEGWTSNCVMHLNLGRQGAIASYEVFDENRTRMPFVFSYHSGRGTRGYYLQGSDECLSWEQLRARWPKFVKALRRAEAAGRSMPSKDALDMFVIYDHPSDLPGGFVVRAWSMVGGAVAAAPEPLGKDLATIDDARKLIPDGKVNIGRFDDDDPKIAEVWV